MDALNHCSIHEIALICNVPRSKLAKTKIMIQQALDMLLETADEALLHEALQRAQEVLTNEQRFYILHGLKARKDTQTESIPELLQHLKTFVQQSKAGYFYREFAIDSENYNWIPPHTEAWCFEMGLWLDKACELVQAKNERAARIVFEACLPLIEQMTEVVFADETGEWMIHTQHDYMAVYEALEQKG